MQGSMLRCQTLICCILPLLALGWFTEDAEGGLLRRGRPRVMRCPPVARQAASCQPTYCQSCVGETRGAAAQTATTGSCDSYICPQSIVAVVSGPSGCLYKTYACKVCRDNSLAYYDGSCAYTVPRDCSYPSCTYQCIPRPVNPIPIPPPPAASTDEDAPSVRGVPPALRYMSPDLQIEGVPRGADIEEVKEGVYAIEKTVVDGQPQSGIRVRLPLKDDVGNETGSRLVRLCWFVHQQDPDKQLGLGIEVSDAGESPDALRVESHKVSDHVYVATLPHGNGLRHFVVVLCR